MTLMTNIAIHSFYISQRSNVAKKLVENKLVGHTRCDLFPEKPSYFKSLTRGRITESKRSGPYLHATVSLM